MPTIFRDKVTAGDITFNDRTEWPSVNAVEWGLDVLDGWSETPELDAPFAPLGSVDGEVPGEFFAARGKPLIIAGYVHATTRLDAELLSDVIVRDAFPRNREIEIVRYEAVPKVMRVRRNGPIEMSWVGPYAFRWAVPTRAADPFKYGLTSSSDSAGVAGQSVGGRTYPRMYPLVYTTIASGTAERAVLTNTGTTDSKRLTIVINGPLVTGGWRLVNETTDDTLKFDVGLAASDTLEIDFKTETALLNGFPISSTMSGDFFPIVPGVNIIKLYGDFDPDTSFTATVFSAWE